MKQFITIEQWDELSNKEKDNLIKSQIKFTQKYWHNEDATIKAGTHYYALTIGQMIEYLGNDWKDVIFEYDKDTEMILFKNDNEFIDNLWKAVKYKVKQ